MKVKFSIFSLFTLGLATFTLLATMGSTKEVMKQTATFDYSPKKTVASGSSTMSLLLLKPTFAKSMGYDTDVEILNNLRENMASDVQELLVAKGFLVKGPYDSEGELLFNDKKKSQLTIVLDVDIQFQNAQGGWKTVGVSQARATGRYEGTVALGGRINLTAFEPMSREKVWVKSLDVPKQSNILIKTSRLYYLDMVSNPSVSNHELFTDPGVHNSLVSPLQNIYNSCFDKIENFLEPEELKALNPQIMELKARQN